MTETARTRPLSVIEADIEVTRAGRSACRAVVDAVLAERHKLLAAGWTDRHPLCQALDRDAERWAAQAEHQRRALLDLMAERDREPL